MGPVAHVAGLGDLVSLDQVLTKYSPCPRCGRPVRNDNGAHSEACQKVPVPDDLADQLDNDPQLTAKALAKKYGTTARFIIDRLVGTRWSRDRLDDRMARVADGHGPHCPRCGLKVAHYGFLCPACVQEVAGMNVWTDWMGVVPSAGSTNWNVNGR